MHIFDRVILRNFTLYKSIEVWVGALSYDPCVVWVKIGLKFGYSYKLRRTQLFFD